MAFDLNEIRTDPQKDVEGVWREPRPGLRILVARLGNPRYVNELRRLTRPYRGRRLGEEEDRKVMQDCTAEAAAKTVLLGWEGLMDRGEPVEYSWETAMRYLKEVDEFRSIVMDEAADLDAFRAEDAADAEKNSKTPSGGKSHGGAKQKTPSGGPAGGSGD